MEIAETDPPVQRLAVFRLAQPLRLLEAHQQARRDLVGKALAILAERPLELEAVERAPKLGHAGEHLLAGFDRRVVAAPEYLDARRLECGKECLEGIAGGLVGLCPSRGLEPDQAHRANGRGRRAAAEQPRMPRIAAGEPCHVTCGDPDVGQRAAEDADVIHAVGGREHALAVYGAVGALERERAAETCRTDGRSAGMGAERGGHGSGADGGRGARR